MLQIQMSADSILQLDEMALLSLFDVDTAFVMVTCIVSNGYGNDSAITLITICGTHYNFPVLYKGCVKI